eukprot:jgi/Galph1/865/GphlegSOOS_G5670.1
MKHKFFSNSKKELNNCQRRQFFRKNGVTDLLQLTEEHYYVKDNCRYVIPYPFEYIVNTKKRWFGKTVLEVFGWEFPHGSTEYWKREISEGRFLINNSRVSPDSILENGQVITHRVHRHKSVTLAEPVKIVFMDDRIVVVNKPASLPVHPCGSFRKNSLLARLAVEHGLVDLHVVHRLDRQTSGLVILARDKETAENLSKRFRERQVEKTYIARVLGKFPEETITCSIPLNFSEHECIGSCSETGKESITIFQCQSYDERSQHSIVACKPKTGRTHQIRLHLNHLGFPVVNDPLYGPSRDIPTEEHTYPLVTDISDEILKQGESFHCPTCPRLTVRDSAERNGSIWLHAMEYKSEVWKFVAPLPQWAISA